MVRFDAYTATTQEATHEEALDLIVQTAASMWDIGRLADMTFTQGKGFHTFAERIAVKDRSGSELGSVMWGGRQGDRVLLEVKGEATPACVKRLRERYRHRCTRVDVCADWDAPGSFERLLGPVLEVKEAHRLQGERRGDWEDFPELGRTMYLGSPASPIRSRLYEKGKQPEYRHLSRPNWTRLELQVRPAKEAKEVFAELEAVDVWGASRWTRDLAARVLQAHVDPHPAGTTWRESQRDRALAFMCKQYGAHLVSLAGDLGGWDCVGLTLGEIIKAQREKGR